jgi:hypothetical protein
LIAIVASGTAAAEPDFSGVWQAYASVPGLGPGGAAALTEEGARLVDGFFAELGDNYVEPGAYCVPPGMGYSIGRWEGETLVIETTGFNDLTWFDRAGNYHTSALKVTERFVPVGENHLQYSATIEDPNVFTRPWTINMPLYRHIEPNAQILEFKCVPFVEELLYKDLELPEQQQNSR